MESFSSLTMTKLRADGKCLLLSILQHKNLPQSSVLGPLFFIIYVNDMMRACEGLDLVLFADDTNIFAEGSNPAELFGRVNRGLDELSRWFRCNRLTLNLKKTENVYFAGPQGHGLPPGG